jgi:hypothetical protein
MMSDSDFNRSGQGRHRRGYETVENALLAHFPSLHRPAGFTQVSA